MLNPFVILFSNIIQIYNWILIIWVVMSLLISFNVINRHQLVVARIFHILNRLTEPALRPIRRLMHKYLPDLGGIDLSPIVLILLLQFLNNALFTYLYDYTL